MKRAVLLAAALVALAFAPSALVPARLAAQATQSAAPLGVVNINTASAEELTRLPGIGPTRAQAILAARQRQPFRRPQDILRVRGIGRATFRRLERMLAVDGPTTLGVRGR